MKLVVLVLLSVALQAWAHEGEDHGQPPAAMPSSGAATRAAAQTPDVELVAVLEGARLVLYLDRFATNEPLADAVVEVESGAFKANAGPLAPGVYAAPAAELARPGKHALTLAVQAGDVSDLLTLTLDVAPPPSPAATARPPWRQPLAWAGAAAALALLLGVTAWRRRPTRRVAEEVQP